MSAAYENFDPLGVGLKGLWEYLKDFGNSAFTTSLAGAFAGAYAAQKIAENSKVRDELISEIRFTNNGLVLALTISNLAIAIKKQHVSKLKASYDADVARAKAHMARVRSGTIGHNSPLTLSMDFITLQEIAPPIAALHDIVLGKIATSAKAIATVTALADGITNLNAALRRRNDLITDYKAKKFPDGARIQDLYLGLEYGDAKVNNEYGNTLHGIHSYMDDVIFFGMTLCEELQRHGQRVMSNNKKNLKGATLDLVEVDFQPAKELGLIPNDDDYKEWASGMRAKSKPKPGWWARRRNSPV